MGKSFRPGVGNIADFTEGKLRKKIIQYGEETTADNEGDPGADGVFYQRVGTELQFKSLATGSNITITDDDEGTLTISAQLQHDDVGWYQKGANNIESSGSVAITGSLKTKSTLSASGNSNLAGNVAVEGNFLLSGSATLGNAAADVTTITGRLTGSQGAKFSQIVQGTAISGSAAISGQTLNVGAGRVTVNVTGDLFGASAVSGSGIGTFVGGVVTEGTLKASGSVTLGDAAADVTTVTGRLTASVGALINGRLGIGHNAAEEELDVVGDARVIKNSNSAGARAKVTIAKSRGTFGSEAVIQSGDTIGELQFDGYDGNSYEEFASIYAKADAAVGDGDTPGAIYFATTADGAASATQRMVIDSAGDIQISGSMFVPDDEKIFFGNGNETFIQYREAVDDFLTISGSAGGIVLSGSTVQIAGTLEGASPLKIAGGVQIVQSANGDDASWTFDSGPIEFSGSYVATSNDTVLHFGDMHHCGIYCASGSWNDSWMDVSGSNITLSGSLISATGRIGVGIQLESGAITHGITLPNTDNVYGKIKANAYTTYSSLRYKNNIEPIQDAMGKIQSLSGVTYNWKKSNSSDIGFIAEDVGKIMPEIVEWDSDGVNAQSMDYTRIIPVVVEAIKHQQKQIDQLQQAIDKIKK